MVNIGMLRLTPRLSLAAYYRGLSDYSLEKNKAPATPCNHHAAGLQFHEPLAMRTSITGPGIEGFELTHTCHFLVVLV